MAELKTANDLLAADGAVVNLLPPQMAEVTQHDAEYHGEIREEWIDLNQIQAERNQRFHDDALREIAADIPADGVILELGSGVGYDAQRFLQLGVPFGCYIVSEISPRLLEYARKNMQAIPAAERVRYCCIDAMQILIADSQVDRVLAIAAVHHLPGLNQGLSEIDRVTRPGAKIVFAIEPNRLWSSFLVAMRPVYRRLFSSKSHSAADEEAEGFRIADFRRISAEFGWKIHRIVPIWFFTGFLHLGLESLYRLLRLRRRITAPRLEKACLAVDKLFFLLPLADRLAWHYSVIFSK